MFKTNRIVFVIINKQKINFQTQRYVKSLSVNVVNDLFQVFIHISKIYIRRKK